MKPQSLRHLSRLFVTVASVSALSTYAFAGNATWTGTTDGNWATGTNWGGSAPGSTSSTTNTDTATLTPNSHTTITVDANRNIQNISLDGAGFSYTIGSAGANAGNALLLTSGGTIQIASTMTNNTKTLTINAPLVLEPASATTNGTYTFANNNATASNKMVFAGNISGGTTTGTITLNLNGASTSGLSTISGAISNGGAAALGVTVNSGTWTLSGANSYTGATSLVAGTVNIANAAAIGSGTLSLGNGIIINNTSGGALTETNNSPVSIGGVTVNFTGTNNLNFGSGAVSLTSGNDTFALSNSSTLGFNGLASNTSNGNQQHTVNGAGSTLAFNGGYQLNTGASPVTVSFVGSGNVTLAGGVTNGGAGPNGLTYSGTGTMNLSGTNTYSGTTTLGNGTLILTGSNSSAGATTVTGGTLVINSAGALASGLLTLGNGATLNNTSGSPITETNNPTVSIGNATVNFTGSNNLNLGSGAVSLTATGGETFALGGSASTLTFGTVTNTSGGNQGTTVNGTGNTFAWGGFALGTGATTITDTLNGSGNINITGAVTNGGSVANNLTYSGTGTLALGGSNTYSGLTTVSSGTVKLSGTNSSTVGTTTLSGGTLAVNNAGALAGGLLSLNGGTLDNTSGAAIAGQTNNPIITLGSFAYSTSAGTTNNSLNLGTGAITLASNQTVTLNGGGALTLGGTMTTTNAAATTLTVTKGTGTTAATALNLTNYALSGPGSTVPHQDVINGSGNVNINGKVTDGVSALSGLNYSGSGTLSLLSGTSTYTGNTAVSGSGTLAIGADSTPTSGTVTSGPLGTGYLIFSGGTVIATGAAHTIANNIAINADVAGTIGGSQNLTFGGLMSLNTSTVTGAGSHFTTLAVTNTALTTFAGGINLTGVQLTFTNSGNVLVNSTIAGNGNFLAYSGTGTLTLSGANSYAATTNVNQGTVVAGTNSLVSTNGAFGNSGTINLGSTSFTGAANILTNGAFTIGRAIQETSGFTNASLTIGGNQVGSTSTYSGAITLAAGTTTTTTTLSAATGGEVDFTGAIGGADNISIGGGGLVKLTGTNTFGSTTANANSVTVTGGTTLTTTNGTTNLGATGNTLIFNNGIYKFGSAVDISAHNIQFNSGGGTLDTNGLSISLGNAIGNSGTGTGAMTVIDSTGTTGNLTLNAVNTYTGGTVLSSGTLTTGSGGTLGNTSGTLTVNGGGLNLNGTSQGVGNLTGSGGSIYNNTSSSVSTLTVGNGDNGGGTYNGVIKDNTGTGGKVALTKTGSAGTGTITLNGANTYTGATQVTNGTLAIGASGSLGGTAVTLSGGNLMVGTLNSNTATTIGTSGNASVTNATGGSITFANGVANAVSNAADNLNINSATAGQTTLVLSGGTINIGVGGSTGSDEIILGNGGLASITGSTTINLNVISALNGTTQQLIAWGAGSTFSSSSFAIGTVNGFGAGSYTLSLSATSAGLFLSESSVSSAYWKGTQGSSWATNLPGGPSNFTSDLAGSINRTAALDTNTSVVFNATGGTNYANTTLDANTTINNLTFNTGGVGIGSGASAHTLSISAAGSGITVNSGLGATTETISSNVAMGASQTWTVSDLASTLLVSGNVSGSGFNLIKAGSGTLTLTGTNSYSGTTTVQAGALNIQSADALDGTAGVTVSNGAALQLAGSGFTTTTATPLSLTGTGVSSGGALENVSGTNNYTGSITLTGNTTISADTGSSLTLSGANITNTAGNTLTLSGGGTGDLISVLSSGTLVKNGTGLWGIEGANTYTGGTTVNTGTLQLGTTSGSFSSLTFLGSATGALTVNTGGTLDLNGWNLSVGNLNGTGGTITNSFPFASVLTLNAQSASSYAGSITDGTGGVSLIVAGPAVQTLTGSNSYTGSTSITSGALNIASSGALGSTSGVTVSSGAALQMSGGITTGSATPLSLVGTGTGTATPNGTGALENVSGNNTYTGAITLTGATSIGSDAGTLNLASTATIGGSGNLTLTGGGNGNIAGAIGSGVGSVTVASTGTWTPSNTNTTGTWTLTNAGNSYSGGTTVLNGTLAYSNPAALTSNAITLGSTTANTTAALNYTGAGGTVADALNLNGNQTILFGNSGSGSIVYSATPTISTGNKTIILGNATDTAGGSIGSIVNGSSSTTTLVKTGAQNSTWILTGSNSYTGGTTINGGVLQIANASALPTTGILNLNGTASNAILQTQGTLNLTTGTNLNWGNNNGGFSAIGGTLTLNINGGAQLTWSSNIGTAGASTIAFGSTTSNAQVVLPNAITLNTNDPYSRNIYVEKGVGGDSTLLSGVLSNGTGTGAATGINKLGAGTLILSGANTYSGYTTVTAGTLVAAGNSLATVAGAPVTSGVFGTGQGPSATPAPATYTPIYLGNSPSGGALTTGGVINPTIMISGNYTVANPINVDWNNGTGQVYGVGGYSDAASTFSGAVTLTGSNTVSGNTFAVTQVATSGTNALNITGGITATNGGNINFANVGAVNVSTTGITNGGATAVSVTQTGAGTTTFAAANTYTGGTTVSGGKLRLTGSTSATGLFTVGGVSGGLSTATLSGTGTVGGALTTSSANSNVAHLAPGVNTSGNVGAAGTLTIAGNLTIGSGTNIDIDLTSSVSSGNDLLAMSGGTLSFGSSLTFNFNQLSGANTLNTTSPYTLISGFTGTPTLPTTFTTTGATGYSAVYTIVGNALDVTFTNNTLPPAAAYYTGSTSTDLNTASNFNTTASGSTATGTAIGSITDLYLTANSANNTAPTLNTGNVTVNSVTFTGAGTAATAGVTLSGTNTLTVGGGSGANTPGIVVQSGSGANTISTPVALGVGQTWSNASSNLLTVSGGVTGTGNLALQDNSTGGITLSGGSVNNVGSITNSGSGSGSTRITSVIGSNVTSVIQNSATSSLVLSGANNYAGGTSVTAGRLAVNNTSGSGTGTGSVSVTGTGILGGSGTIKPTGGAGVTIASGATLASGSLQTANAIVNSGNGSVNGTGTGGGLTLDNTEASSSLLSIAGGAKLSFALGSSTAYNGGSGSLNFANPNTNSTYLNITGNTTDQIFATSTLSINISLIDLTYGAPSGGVALTLRSQNPYLLIQTALGNNNDFANLVTTGGNAVNGYVLGVSNGTGGYTPFSLGAYDINGNQINTGSNLQNLQLYLYNGDLEVVPEPGTWALMLGGLALLIFIQRRRSKMS